MTTRERRAQGPSSSEPRARPARSKDPVPSQARRAATPAKVSPTVEVRLVFSSGFEGRKPTTLSVSPGTPMKALLRTLGLPPEGTVLFWNGEPVPSDLPVPGPGDLEIVRSFSGG